MLILVILGHRQPAQNRIESCRLQEPGNSVMKLVIDPEHVVTAEGTQITKLGQVSSLTRWDARLNKNDPYEPHVLYFRPNLGLLASSFSFKQCNERPSFLTHGRIGHLYLTPVQFAQHRINCVLFYRKWTLPSFTINQVLEHSWSLVWKDSWWLSWLLQSNNTFFFLPASALTLWGFFHGSVCVLTGVPDKLLLNEGQEIQEMLVLRITRQRSVGWAGDQNRFQNLTAFVQLLINQKCSLLFWLQYVLRIEDRAVKWLALPCPRHKFLPWSEDMRLGDRLLWCDLITLLWL